MHQVVRNADSQPGTVSHEHDESVNNRIEHVIPKHLHTHQLPTCAARQVGINSSHMRHFQLASLAHIPRLSLTARDWPLFMACMKSRFTVSRGHNQAQTRRQSE